MRVVLQGFNALTGELLLGVCGRNITRLKLVHCGDFNPCQPPRKKVRGPSPLAVIARQCVALESLHLVGVHSMTVLGGGGATVFGTTVFGAATSPLPFPSLKSLYVEDCPALTRVCVRFDRSDAVSRVVVKQCDAIDMTHVALHGSVLWSACRVVDADTLTSVPMLDIKACDATFVDVVNAGVQFNAPALHRVFVHSPNVIDRMRTLMVLKEVMAGFTIAISDAASNLQTQLDVAAVLARLPVDPIPLQWVLHPGWGSPHAAHTCTRTHMYRLITYTRMVHMHTVCVPSSDCILFVFEATLWCRSGGVRCFRAKVA